MATYKIRVDYSSPSQNGWFFARLKDNAIWVLPHDQAENFNINVDSDVSNSFKFSIAEKSKLIHGSVNASSNAVRFQIEIYVETNEDKIEFTVGSEGEIRFRSDRGVDQLKHDGPDRLLTLQLK